MWVFASPSLLKHPGLDGSMNLVESVEGGHRPQAINKKHLDGL